MLSNYDNKKSPFKVPDNYFEQFNNSILSNLDVKQKQEEKTVRMTPIWKKVIPWTAVAAAFAGILFGVGFFDNISPKTISGMDGLLLDEDYYQFIESEVIYSDYESLLYDEMD